MKSRDRIDWSRGIACGIAAIGGFISPVLLRLGLQRVSGLVGSLLLNLEGVSTMVLAVTLFGDRLRVSSRDRVAIVQVKALSAGGASIVLALTMGQQFPGRSALFDALLVGFFCYGISIVLDVTLWRDVRTTGSWPDWRAFI